MRPQTGVQDVDWQSLDLKKGFVNQMNEIELQAVRADPVEVIARLSAADTPETAKECLLSLSQLLDEANLVKDGTIQQADVIRAAKLAKQSLSEHEWAEDEYRDLLYKFAESADATSREEAVKDEKVATVSKREPSEENNTKKGSCCWWTCCC